MSVGIALLGFGVMAPNLRRMILPWLTGFVLPVIAELAAYRIATGDALHGWRLALGHTRIRSTALDPSVDLTQSPLFNPAFIGGWSPAAGLSVHWTIDGLLNLLANPGIGPTLVAALALLALDGRALLGPRARSAVPRLLVVACCLYFGGLVYALAVDPDPRMFLPVAAAACALFGIAASLRWMRGDRALPMIMLFGLVVFGVLTASSGTGFREAERAAPALLAADRGVLAVDPATARFLALVPAVGALPRHPAPGIDRVLVLTQRDCASALPGRWRTGRARRFIANAYPARALTPERASLCLVSRASMGRLGPSRNEQDRAATPPPLAARPAHPARSPPAARPIPAP